MAESWISPPDLSISRPSLTTTGHLENAYWTLRGGDTRQPRRKNDGSMFGQSLKAAAKYVDESGADPYEYMRILFLSCDGAYPYPKAIAGVWAFAAYEESFAGGPSLGLKIFRAEGVEIAEMVFSRGMPLDEVVESGDFNPVTKVIWCSDDKLEEFVGRFGAVAANRVRWDRDLKSHILENHADRASRVFRTSVSVQPSGSPLEVGPSKATPRRGRD